MHWTLAVLRRDLRAHGKGLLIALVALALFGAFIFTTFAADPDPFPAERTAQFARSAGTPFYGMATLAGLVAFGATAAAIYGKDVQSGSVQELFHYPVTANRVHAAKVLVAAGFGTVALLAFGLLVQVPMARAAGLPLDFAATFVGRVLAAALVAQALLLASAAGLALLVARVTQGVAFAFHRLYALLGVLALVATETVMESLGLAVLTVLRVLRTREQVEAYRDFMEAVVQLSPIHAGGRVLSDLNGVAVDLHLGIIVPLAVVLAVAGWWLGREVYPDVFLARLTA